MSKISQCQGVVGGFFCILTKLLNGNGSKMTPTKNILLVEVVNWGLLLLDAPSTSISGSRERRLFRNCGK